MIKSYSWKETSRHEHILIINGNSCYLVSAIGEKQTGRDSTQCYRIYVFDRHEGGFRFCSYDYGLHASKASAYLLACHRFNQGLDMREEAV